MGIVLVSVVFTYITYHFTLSSFTLLWEWHAVTCKSHVHHMMRKQTYIKMHVIVLWFILPRQLTLFLFLVISSLLTAMEFKMSCESCASHMIYLFILINSLSWKSLLYTPKTCLFLFHFILIFKYIRRLFSRFLQPFREKFDSSCSGSSTFNCLLSIIIKLRDGRRKGE